MREYKFFNFCLLTDSGHAREVTEMEEDLNALAIEGWRVVCQLSHGFQGFLLVRDV